MANRLRRDLRAPWAEVLIIEGGRSMSLFDRSSKACCGGRRERGASRAMRRLAFMLVPLAAANPVAAQGPAILDAKAAQAIVAGCIAESAPKMQSHAIAVVDTGGHLIAALRMDGNGRGSFDFALAKAEPVAAW